MIQQLLTRLKRNENIEGFMKVKTPDSIRGFSMNKGHRMFIGLVWWCSTFVRVEDLALAQYQLAGTKIPGTNGG